MTSKKKYELRKCNYCREEYIPKNIRNIYCSHKCAANAYHKNNKISERKYRLQHMKENRLSSRKYSRKRRKRIIYLLGNKCCNPFNLEHPSWLNSIEMLQVDHINGGGGKQMREFGGKYYSYVLSSISSGKKEFQILCVACNWLKRFKLKEVKKRID